ncbi:hypothetical protein N2152v2_010735 [Parachlorella kessleri]
MGKGGPLAFLNKKTWHPGRVQNLEEVWKREQAAAKEEQQMRDLQKQIAEERAREELHQVAEAAGHKIKSDRLDWMYQGGMQARQEADQRLEAAAGAGEAAAEQQQQEEQPSRVDQAVALPSFYAEDTPASANEVWQRLHSDPLFAIKQQEHAARKSIVANPVQMQAIKSQARVAVKALLALPKDLLEWMVKQLKELASKAGKKDKKERKEKKHKKEKKEKKKKKHGRDVSSDTDPDQDPHPAKRQRSASPRLAGPAAAAVELPGRGADRGFEREPADRDFQGGRGGYGGNQRNGDFERGGQGGYQGGGYRGGGRDYDGHGSRRGADVARGREADRSHNGDKSRGADRSRERRRSRERHDERRNDMDQDRSREQGGHRRDGGQKEAPPARSRHSHSRSRSADRGRGGSSRDAAAPAADREGRQQRDVPVHLDGASAQGRVAEYGLNRGHLPEDLRRQDRRLLVYDLHCRWTLCVAAAAAAAPAASDFAAETRKRLEEAARRKEEEEREAAAQRAQQRRREYRPGQLSAEERAAKLAEMAAAAEEHEQQRGARLAAVAEKEREEEEAHVARHHTDTAQFLAKASKDVYGTTAGGSLEDRVGRRKFFSERRS